METTMALSWFVLLPEAADYEESDLPDELAFAAAPEAGEASGPNQRANSSTRFVGETPSRTRRLILNLVPFDDVTDARSKPDPGTHSSFSPGVSLSEIASRQRAWPVDHVAWPGDLR